MTWERIRFRSSGLVPLEIDFGLVWTQKRAGRPATALVALCGPGVLSVSGLTTAAADRDKVGHCLDTVIGSVSSLRRGGIGAVLLVLLLEIL